MQSPPNVRGIPENVKVSVTDSEANGVGSVHVTLENGEGAEYSGVTGSAGGCTIKEVPPGDYTVSATASGYDDYVGSFTVSPDNRTLTIIMESV